MTLVALTLVNVNLTEVAFKPGITLTVVSIDPVDTGSALTLIVLALVNVQVTHVTSIARVAVAKSAVVALAIWPAIIGKTRAKRNFLLAIATFGRGDA